MQISYSTWPQANSRGSSSIFELLKVFFHFGDSLALFFSGFLSNISEGSSSIPFAGSFSLASSKCWCCPKSHSWAISPQHLLLAFSEIMNSSLSILPFADGPKGPDINAILSSSLMSDSLGNVPMRGTSISLFVVGGNEGLALGIHTDPLRTCFSVLQSLGPIRSVFLGANHVLPIRRICTIFGRWERGGDSLLLFLMLLMVGKQHCEGFAFVSIFCFL